MVDELVSRSAETWSELREALERPTPSDGLEPGSSQRFALFAMLRTAFRQSACDTGLVLVLDDLQWADGASTVLLADVAGNCGVPAS